MINNINIRTLFIFGVISLLFSKSIIAQDLIIKKDNEAIKAKILEIGTNEIKYKLYEAPDGPTIVIDKKEVKSIKIKGEEGKSDKVMSVNEDPMSVNNSAIVDKTSSLKFHFFSPLTKKLAFSYEWMIRPGFNWEAGLGIVGPGTSLMDEFLNLNPRGVYLRTGPKFLLGNSSDIEIAGGRYAHPLKGRYFKVEALFYTLAKNYDVELYDTASKTIEVIRAKSSFTGVALHLIYGRQYIFGNSITVGWYAGIGYGGESRTTSYSNSAYTLADFDPIRHSHTYSGDRFPVTFTAGFNIGYIFKTPEWVSNIGKSNKSRRPPSRHSMD
ncbi:MAG: hypothetical protein WBM13_03995 [Bacteroidia bacterium]